MKKAIVILAVLCGIGFCASAQSVDTNAVELIQPIEISPEFPGGDDSMYAFIACNYRLPQNCDIVKGVVIVSFVIEKDGTVSNAKVKRGIGKYYDEEALRVVRMMPRWIPARLAGSETPIRSEYVLPIKFRLE